MMTRFFTIKNILTVFFASLTLALLIIAICIVSTPRINDTEIASLLSQSSYKIIYHEDDTKDWLVVKDRNVYIAKFRGNGKLTPKDTANKYFYFVEIEGIKQTLESYFFHK